MKWTSQYLIRSYYCIKRVLTAGLAMQMTLVRDCVKGDLVIKPNYMCEDLFEFRIVNNPTTPNTLLDECLLTWMFETASR